jgi:sulfite exporter TauE/SafE
MTPELNILVLTAISLGFIHTLFGPDHFIPFVAMAKAGKWSTPKTVWITILCGIGHVGSSIILGFIGIALGLAVARLEMIESVRGNIAGWILITFGLLYTIWGLRKAYRTREHAHRHSHGDGSDHAHFHRHSDQHVHIHDRAGSPNLTPWILFTIFIFGPCEPLIPILMYPAAQGHIFNVVIVSLVFGIATIGTMLTLVLGSIAGLRFLPARSLERFTHALAGASILFCGIAIQFLGL